MKTSNKILFCLILVLFATTVFVDFLLKSAYLKINLTNPLKNYTTVNIRPFRYLKITGGNSYVIEIKQAAQTDMKVMTSRKNFLNTAQNGDTLFIRFTVASHASTRNLESLPLGIIISSPNITAITADGSNNILTSLKTDNLTIILTGNASAEINGADIGKLTAKVNQNANCSFHLANKIVDLNLQLADNAAAYLLDINYSFFNPRLSDDSQIVFGAQTAAKLGVNETSNKLGK